MRLKSFGGGCAVALAALSLTAACDKSRQSADGSTQAGDAGTAAAAGGGTVADTGSPEQGGANGTPSGKSAVNGMSTDASGRQPSPETPAGSVHAKGP